MSTQLKHRVFFWISFIVMFIQSQNEAFASHAQSADITYQCLGGNQYKISLSFYRDCAGVTAPTTATINISSASSGQNLTLTLNQITGTGIEVSPICTSMSTQCSGGAYPGVEEYKYSGIVTLPLACPDWIFSFSLCCRNAAISTIVNPGAENIYVEAFLNNVNFPCNSSPVFSNPPIPFACIGQSYCFNNGSYDVDRDSLYYTLIAPRTGPSTTVTYNSPYSASQPLLSLPAVSFNNLTGDMCMSPTQIEVTVFAIVVEEWRTGIMVGRVMRDIQLRTISCTNNNPYVNGINNTSAYSLTACAGVPLSFSISTFDIDSSQNVSITWNAGISSAAFTSSGGARPVGTFSWTPSAADIGSTHCFTVTARDDNCPYNGSQTYAFCISVTGIVLAISSTPDNCNASNGTAQVVVVSGMGPFSYNWIGGGTSSNQNGLTAGTYTVNVTGAGGCVSSATATVTNGSAPGNLIVTGTNSTCYAANNGTALANANGGQPPYTYLWSNGATTSTVSGLAPGTYSVSITTANGCVTIDSILITAPLTPMTYSSARNNVICFGGSSGNATINVMGGTPPYTYQWNTIPIQTSSTAINLTAGNYMAFVSDANGCMISDSVTISQPAALVANGMVIHHVTCYGFADGYAIVGASGGTGTYNYSWSTSPVSYTQTINGLAPGNYFTTVTDANGCIANSYVTITQPTPLTLSAAAFPVSCHGSCNGQTVVIPAGGTGAYSYHWLPTSGTGASITGLCPGGYTVTVTDGNGCVIDSSLTVTEPTAIVVNAIGSTTICRGQSTVVSASATGGSGSYSYNWTGVGTGATQTVSPLSPVSYSVSATDIHGCISNIATVSINVTSLTAANLTVSDGSVICYGHTANVSSMVGGNTGVVSINWSSGLGSGNGPFTVSPPTTTTYTVTVTDACSHSVTESVTVIVHPLPIINISPQTLTSCSQVTAYFADNSPSNINSTYYWTFGDGFASPATIAEHIYETSGNYDVGVTITSHYGCVNTTSTIYHITINTPPVADFNPVPADGTTISPVYNFTNASSNASTYNWAFGDGSVSSQANPEHAFAEKGAYVVTLYTISSEGCRDSISKTVEIKPEFTIYIPNAFTPDGDHINDYFSPKGSEIQEFKMMIFDRWGEMIYQTDNIQDGWDGRANNGGKIAESGVYVYRITAWDPEEHKHNYTGHVTLLAQE
jgi:gliding motility-associated-like protein